MSSMTLQEAADALGVHYMTAYRYVRLGMLYAEKVGGAWQVDASELADFQQRRQSPTGAVGGAGNGGRSGDARWAERFEARLVAGDGRGAWGVVEAALSSGRDLDAIYLDVIAPAMVSIGDRWAAGELDVAVEHRATGIAMRVIGRLGHRSVRRGRSRGVVVIANPAGELHALATAIVSDLLRIRGWEVSDLGADVPIESLLFSLREEPDVKALGLSITSAGSREAGAESCAAVREAHPEVRIVMGGGAVAGEDEAVALGADAYATNGVEMHELLDTWFPQRRPMLRDEGLAAGD